MAKFPDPKFFRMKDHMNWKLQAENLKEVGGIIGELFKETDWKDVGKNYAADAKGFAKRLSYEAGLLKKMSPEEIKDLIVNGEKQLGKLYAKGKMDDAQGVDGQALGAQFPAPEKSLAEHFRGLPGEVSEAASHLIFQCII